MSALSPKSLIRTLAGIGLGLAALAAIPGGCPQPDDAGGLFGGTAKPGTSQPAVPVSDRFGLWSRGVNLRGANVYQRRVYPAIDGTQFLGPGPIGPSYSQDDFDRLRALGANFVVISHPGVYSEKIPFSLDAAVEANLDGLIARAESAGLMVVISFRTGPGRSEFSIFEGQTWFPQSLVNNDVWRLEAPQQAWANMWRHVAERYRGRACVIGYDLMCEPNGPSTQFGEFDPAAFQRKYAGTFADWNRLHPRLVTAIRAVDAETPILISASSYGSAEWLPYVSSGADPRLVYVVHHYAPFEYTHQESTGALTYPGTMVLGGRAVNVNRAYLESLLAPIDAFKQARGVPVAVLEFGVHRSANGANVWYRDQAELFEKHGLAHAMWLWESSWAGLADADDFNFRHGPNPINHVEVPTSTLITAIRADWERNVSYLE